MNKEIKVFLIALKWVVIILAIMWASDEMLGKIKSLESTIDGMSSQITKITLEKNQLKQELDSVKGKVEELTMVASWYGFNLQGRPTSTGEPFDANAYTCAHKTLPIGTVLIIEYNGKRIPCIVADRGPFFAGRDIDLSYAVAKKVGMVQVGVAKVRVYKINLDRMLE